MNLIIPEINKNQLEQRIESIKKRAKENVELYKGLTDPIDMKDAKAKLNNFIKDADDIRKNTTRSLDEAKKALKGAVDEATKEAKELADHYKSELDEIEEERKREKKEQIMALDGAATYFEYYDWNSKWLNKGAKLADIQEEINDGVRHIESMQESIATTAEALDLNPDDYKGMMKTKQLHEITAQMKRDKEMIEARLKRDEETKPEPKRPEATTEETKTYAYERQLIGTPTDVKAFVDAIEDMAKSYGVEIKKEES